MRQIIKKVSNGFLVLFFILILIMSCRESVDKDEVVDKSKLLASDYRLFQNTPAWNLAKAVWEEDLSKIELEISKNPSIINYQDSLWGNTLLHLSIYHKDFKSFKKLLELGANVNVYDSITCSSPIIDACRYYDDNPKYVKELIKHGANVNDMECGDGKEKQKLYTTALVQAIDGGNYKIAKVLVENGADVNYYKVTSPFATSIISNNPRITLYLLENGARCNQVIYKQGGGKLKDIYAKDHINSSLIFLKSKEYEPIMKILKERGCL